MSLRVLHPGLLTTVQDLGRYGHQQEGVPVSGAMDLFALRMANIVVGNDENDAVLEMTLVGASIVFTEDHVIALGGADLGAVVNGKPLKPWRAAFVVKGATLSFSARVSGCRAYLAVAGGIDVPRVLDSRSTYVRASFGGVDGRALRAGDALSAGCSSARSARLATALERKQDEIAIARWTPGLSMLPRYSGAPTVRVVRGSHTDALTSESRDQLFSTGFRVSTNSDRMGYRLDGPKLRLKEPLELLSEAVVFGTIQLPPGGDPIVLMADRQTTGGYPRVGEVASVDLPLMAQLAPGDHVRFTEISIEEAQQLYLTREEEIAQVKLGIATRHSLRQVM